MFVSAILIAGGRARRVGPPRPLVEVEGRSVVASFAETLLRTCADEVVVVLGKRTAEGFAGLEPSSRLRVVVDRRHAEKDRPLLRLGVEAAHPDATAYLIVRVDGPPFGAETIDRILSAYLRERKPVAVVVNGVGLECPVLISRRLREELLEDAGEGWLRSLVSKDAGRLLLLRVDPRGGVRIVEPPGARPSTPFRRGAPEKAD